TSQKLVTAIASQVIFRVFPRKVKARVLAPIYWDALQSGRGERSVCCKKVLSYTITNVILSYITSQ
ncbi:MAG: hypothetical protein ACYTX0_52305, partial [Nostoc sp.]